MKNSEAQSGNTDTLCFPVAIIQKVLIAAQQKTVLEDEIKNLNERIIEKEKQLAITTTRDSLLIISLNNDIANLKEQKKVLSDALDTMTKELRRQKRRTRLTAFAGILTTVGAALLIK